MGDVVKLRKRASPPAAPTPAPREALTANARTDGLVDVTVAVYDQRGDLVFAQVLLRPEDALAFRASLSDAILDAYATPGGEP